MGAEQNCFPLYSPAGLLSLSDMLKADIENLAWSLSNLREFEKLASDRAKTKQTDLSDQEFRDTTNTAYGLIRGYLKAYGLPVTLDRLATAERHIAIDGYLYSRISTDCDEIHKCASSELSRIYFGYISATKQDELLKAEAAWTATLTAFPNAKKDALMASRCYALECNDAVVYHCMMVLERGMLSLAKKLQVKKATARAWEGIIDDIEKAIDVKQSKLKAKKPGDFLSFLSEAAKEFRYFKDAWRNHTAHGRAQYDENDARKVLIHVRDFMEHISMRLKDKKK